MNRDIGVDMVQSDGKEKQGSSHHEEAVSVDLAMSTPPARMMRGGRPISDCNACENRLSSAVACRPSKAAAKEEGKIGVRELEGSMLVACGGNSGVTEVEGMEIEPRGEGADTQRELAHEVEQVKLELKQKQKQKEHELLSEEEEHKAQLSSSMAPISNVITHEDFSPKDETSPEVTVSHPRRSDSSRSSLRKPKLVKTRRESKSSLKSPESSEAHDTPGAHEIYERGRGEDREDREDFARQSSSSEELNGDGDGDGDEVMDGTGYRCGMCQEDFDNAKSLNAHKMQHPQNYTLRRNPKRSRRFIDQDYTLEAAQAAPTKKTSSMSEEFPKPCTECGKEFGSWKALFGHMRCHPEREWRGIQPPEKNNCGGPPNGPLQPNSRRKKPPPVVVATPIVPVAPNLQEENAKSGSAESRKAQEDASKASDNESDTESIEAAYMNGDRQSFTMGWMTGKRSKRSRQTHRSLDAVNSSKRDQSRREIVITPTENSVQSDMIDALMLLQAANKSRERRTLTSTPESQGRVNAHERRVNVVEAEREDPYQREDIRGKHKVDGDDMSLCGDNEDGGDEPDAGEQGARTKYECATCKRQFKSHQALGGHRASHKKVKGCYARTNVNEGVYDQSPDEDIADDDFLKSEEQLPHELQDASHNSEEEKSSHYLTIARDDNEEMLNAARKTKGHECSICHRVFNSGQALGGHKRCHWGGGATTGPNEATSSNSSKPVQILQSGGQQSRGLKEGVLDLNLPAPECLEEMEQAESGLSPLTYGGSAAPTFFLENSTLPRTLFKDSADKGKHINILQEVELNNQVENQTERLDQFNTLCERGFGSLDTLPGHQKSRVAIMASVPGLTPTSA